MPCSIPCSTKILTLVIALFLFILVGVLYEFAMGPGIYVLLSPQEQELHSSSCGHTCTHSAAHSSKRYEPLSGITLLCQGYCWIGKDANKESTCVMLMIFIIRPSSTLKFQFVFVFSECLWAIFLIKFWKFLVLYLDCGCMAFDFTTQMTLIHLLPLCIWTKKWVQDHQISSKMFRKVHKKEVYSQFHRSHKKFIFWSTFSIICWYIWSKIF